MNIAYDRYSLILDGQRVLIRSGAMHYFRLPGENLWRDRLQKLKMGGYNTVDIYFNWDFHSKAPGQYDFTGVRNVGRLLDIIEEEGLYLIARPGPYINAETTRGGLPGWLLTEPDVILRNRIDGVYHHSNRYMHFVGEWFDHILPFLKGRENMLMIQVENEYSTLEMETDYLEELTAMMRGHGITVPTMHNDFYAAGLYSDVVDLYAIDNYSVTDFTEMDWRTFPELFSVMDHFEETARGDFCTDRPLMVAELQAGWFAGWKGVTYEAIHKSLGREHIGLITRSFLGQGGTIFNHYKAVGGTNWDHMGATDAYTSYDFAAPISEAGLPTERFYEAKRINLLLQHFDLSQTERVAPETIGLAPGGSLYAVRRCVDSLEAHWLFTRNLTSHPLALQVQPGIVIHTPQHRSQMIPWRVPLKNSWRLESLNVEPLAQGPQCLILPGDSPVMADILPIPPAFEIQSDPLTQAIWGDNGLVRAELIEPLAPNQWATVVLGDYHVVFLGKDLIDRLWDVGHDTFIIGPDLVTGENAMFLSEERTCFRIPPSGKSTVMSSPGKQQDWSLPALDTWECLAGEFPVFLAEAFQPLAPSGSDMDQNGIHEGAVWYRYDFTGPAQTLTIHAQHIWAVFLNGTPLIQSHTFHVHPSETGPEDRVTIQIPPFYLNPGGENELLIFVESLGHHKGFHDDTRDPRGLLSLDIDGTDIRLKGAIKRAILHYDPRTPGLAVDRPQAPVWHARTRFRLDLPEEVYAPLALALSLPVDRVDILLNGVLIGQYWQACRNQTRFYLPEGLLNTRGENTLELTLMQFCPMRSADDAFSPTAEMLHLVPFQTFQKLPQLLATTVDTSLS